MGKSKKPKKLLYLDVDEEWKRVYIKGDKTKYEVSNIGQIRNTKRNNAILAQILDRYGYPQVCLFHKGKRYSLTVHSLVAKAFISNKNKKKTQVNHKNGKKYDNFVGNLEWTTPKENIIHSYNSGLHDNVANGDRHGISKYSEKDIELACQYLEENTKSYSDIFKLTGVPRATLHDIVKKKYWNHISDNYDVEKFNNKNYHDRDKELVKKIKKLAKKYDSTKKIRKKLGIPYNDRINAKILYYIKKYNKQK